MFKRKKPTKWDLEYKRIKKNYDTALDLYLISLVVGILLFPLLGIFFLLGGGV